MRIFTTFLLLPGLCCGPVKSSLEDGHRFPLPDPANSVVLKIPRAEGTVVLDGRLEEPFWQSAAVADRFHRASDAGLSGIEARVLLVYLPDRLLVGLDLPEAGATAEPERCFLSDEPGLLRSGTSFSLSLDPQHEHGVYYQFVTDPAGRRQDLRVSDESWQAEWEVAVDRRADRRWRAEISIPFGKELPAPADGDVWGVNIVLRGLGDEGLLASTPTRINVVDAARFGHLLFRGGMSAEALADAVNTLPAIHQALEARRLEEIAAMCGPEMVDVPGKLTDPAIGEKLNLSGGRRVVCLGLDNPEVIRSRFPFQYERFDNPELQRLVSTYRLEEVVAPGRNQFERMLMLNEWLFDNVPFGSPPPIVPQAFHVLEHGLDGQAFNCTYLSFALMQMMSSLGWTSRKITSVGHGTLDVWSDYWYKWFQIDPSRNSHFRLRGSAVPLDSDEIRRELWRNGGTDMEMVFGVDQRAERVTLETRERDGLLRYRQDGYRWIAYKTRNNFFEIPFAYRNFLYLMIDDEYSRGRNWLRQDGGVDERELFSLRADRRGDIFWTLNQARIHLYDAGNGVLKIQLETVTPNFRTFQVSIDGEDWLDCAPVFEWPLHGGQNFLHARSVNKFGVIGPEHKVVLNVEDQLSGSE